MVNFAVYSDKNYDFHSNLKVSVKRRKNHKQSHIYKLFFYSVRD